jgi:hypothetical protein
VTVTVTLPICPSLLALIVTLPCFTPVTTPDCDTVAVLLFVDDHVIARPVRTLPFASFNVAVSVTVAFSATVGAEGEMVTVATGA